MKLKTLFSILLVGCLISGIFFLGIGKDYWWPKLKSNQAYLFPNFPQDQIDWLELSKAGEKKILFKVNTDWQEKDSSRSLKTEAIDNLLKTVKELKREELVSTNPAKRSIFGVDEEGLEVILKSKEVVMAHFYIGKRGQDFLSNFYRKDGEDNVYLSRQILDQIFTSQLFD